MGMEKTQTPSDKRLAGEFKRGNPEALLAIYQRYRDYLLSVAMAMLCDIGLAEDAVHDVFVSLARNRREFRLRRNLKACLAVSVVNRTRDLRRQVRAAASLDPATRANDFICLTYAVDDCIVMKPVPWACSCRACSQITRGDGSR
jgi:DNA-directed RNA polymerase specialized sigma24 family protein